MSAAVTATCTAHEWISNAALTATRSGYTCTQCGTTTSGCICCDRPLHTALDICEPCLDKAQRIITDIQQYLREGRYVADILGIRAVRYDKTGSPTTKDDGRLPFGLDNIYDDPDNPTIGAIKQPATALDILNKWAQDWADTRGDAHPDRFLEYLHEYTLWAAQNHAGWDDYLTEARQVRAVIRRLLGLEPEKHAAPCVYCGGTVIQEWSSRGLEDTARCTSCHLEWDDVAHLAYTNRHTVIGLRSTHPDMLVTIAEAKRILPEARPGTLDTWARRGRLNPANAKFPTRGTNVRGEELYRLDDIVTAWQDRNTPPA